MAKNGNGKNESLEDLMRALTENVQNQTIVHLGIAGVPQQAIRKIVGVDMKRVTRIVKHINKSNTTK